MRQSTLEQLLTARKGAVAQAEAAELTLRAIDDAIGGVYALADEVKALDHDSAPSRITPAEVRERLTGPEHDPETVDRCPDCGDSAMVRLLPDVLDRSGAPLVGCSRPWHYISPRPEVKPMRPLTAAELPSYELHPREAAR